MRWLALLALAACAHRVPQDKATSKDGTSSGAEALALVDNHATATGIVTYPGGDRVDWKMVELPAKLEGELGVKLTWTTPRPKLRLAVDVFDARNTLVASTRRRARVSAREVVVPKASGKYFIRVYAVGRGDAGRYTLDVAFKEVNYSPEPDWSKVKIPDPPRLADLPAAAIVWGPCKPFDAANPNCAKECPPEAADTHVGCRNVCRPSNPNSPACLKSAVCPNPQAPNRAYEDCLKYFKKPCPDPSNPDPANPHCDNVTAPPKKLRVIVATVNGNELRVRTGGVAGITAEWTAEVLVGGDATAAPAGDRTLPGSRLKITRVDADHIELVISTSNLTKQQLDANKWILFRPPPKKP